MKAVYMILSYKTGQFYIGSSIDYNKRIKQHITHLKHGKHSNINLLSIYEKYGLENIKFIIIEEINNPKELLATEQIYINILKPELNINKNVYGGDIITNHPNRELLRMKQIEGTRKVANSEELRKKRSENAKKLYPKGFFHNRKHNDNTKMHWRKTRGQKVSINNVIYNSFREAEEKTGFNRFKLSNIAKLKSDQNIKIVRIA